MQVAWQVSFMFKCAFSAVFIYVYAFGVCLCPYGSMSMNSDIFV